MTTTQFNLRVPKELKAAVTVSSKKNVRSINLEAEYLLKLGLAADAVRDDPIKQWLDSEGIESGELAAAIKAFTAQNKGG